MIEWVALAEVAAIVIGSVSAIGGLLHKTLVRVPQNHDVIIEKWGGGYDRTLKNTGMSLKKPWESTYRKVPLAIIEKKENHATRTKDDIFPNVPVSVHLQIVDSKKFTYESTDAMQQIMTRIGATVKQEIIKFTFAELYQERQTISEAITKNVGPEIERLYGVKMVDVIVDQPEAPSAIQQAFTAAKAAEQTRIATTTNAEAESAARVLKAKADRESKILDGEAKKQWVILDGEGQAGSREAIFKNYRQQIVELKDAGMTMDQIHEFVLQMSKNDTLRDISKEGNLIFFDGAAGGNKNDTLKQVLAALKTQDKGPQTSAQRKGNPPGPANAA